MAYSEFEDIRRLIKWTSFSVGSTLEETDVQEVIAEVDATIDGRIGQMYEVPVTDENDKKVLSFISSRLAAYELAKILVKRAGGDLPDVVLSWKEEAEERIQDILAQELILANTIQKQKRADGLYSHTSHHPDAPEPKWKRGVAQW